MVDLDLTKYLISHNDIDLVKNCLVVRKQKAQNTYRLMPMKAYIIKLIQESREATSFTQNNSFMLGYCSN